MSMLTLTGQAQLEALRAELADERAARARADETIADFREEVQADGEYTFLMRLGRDSRQCEMLIK